MDGDEDHWAEVWATKTDDFLAGYCFAEDTVFYEHSYEFSQHHCDHIGLVYYWDDEQ